MRQLIIGVLIAMFLASCTLMQARDNTAQTGQKLYSAYDRALSNQLDERARWRDRCDDLNDLEYVVIEAYVEAQESLEDKLAAIDLGKQRLTASLPHIATADAFLDGDGSVLTAVNQVRCQGSGS